MKIKKIYFKNNCTCLKNKNRNPFQKDYDMNL